MINAGNEYLHSNNIVAKFAFLFLILIIFILLLNLGINIIDYFMNPSVNPYIIKGSLDGKNSVIRRAQPAQKKGEQQNQNNLQRGIRRKEME